MAKQHHFDLSPFKVEPGTKVDLKKFDPGFTDGLKNKKEGRKVLANDVAALSDVQQRLWAASSHSVLIIFQALDAAGKDGSIRHVMSGVNPQGVDVHSFKAPTDEEKKHHFLYRPARVMPARGRISIFNRSYYEEVLVVRVHPEFLDSQYTPSRLKGKSLTKRWESRYRDIKDFEAKAAQQDTTIIKFFLNVSWEQQRERFMERLNNPEKNWKFSMADVHERQHWKDYQKVYAETLSATSTKEAPWHVIPADNKWFARAAIADTIVQRINALKLEPPKANKKTLASLDKARQMLESETEAQKSSKSQ